MNPKNSMALSLVSILVLLTLFCFPLTTLAEEASAEDPFAIALNPSRDYLIVVNDEHPYEFGGTYDQLLQDDLIYVSDVYGEATPVEKCTYLAFSQLRASLLNQGMDIGLYSAYRTEADQQWVYDYYGSLEGWADTNKVVKPGYSEHHTGILLNVMILYPGDDGEEIWYTETAERQKTIPYFALLHESLADFGFIDRYPEGKEAITGVPSEPYEIRFVGSSAVAHAIMDNHLCLEEFVYGS